MAKNELGVGLNDAFSGDVLIDTDTGKIIKNDSDIMSDQKDEDENDHPAKKKDTDGMIEIPDVTENEGETEETDNSSDGEGNLDDDENSSSLPYFKVLVNALHEKGILSELDQETIDNMDDDESDKLFELIKHEIEKNTEEKLNEKLKDLPSDIKKMIGEGGVKASAANELIKIREVRASLSNIKEEDIEDNVDIQRNLVAESLRNRGYSEDRIKKRISQFENLGDLEEEAKDSLKEILSTLEAEEAKVVDEADKLIKEAEKEREDSLKNLKKEVFDSDHIIEGMKLTEKEKQRIYDSMTKVVEKDSAGNPLNAVMVTRSKNPLAFEKALHYYHALGLFDFDDEGNFKPDLSKIKLTAKKSAVDELSKALKTPQRNQTGRPARENKMDRAKLKEQIERMKKALPL